MENVNDTYFDGYYKEIWRAMIPGELTIKETDFLLSHFQLQPGSKVLDIMCGYGRHALALGRKGIEVTAVDNLDYYIREIEQIAAAENLPVKAVHHNVATYTSDEQVDLALCMGNSLNFFPADDTVGIFNNLARQLKPGGHLCINTWSLTEIVIKQFSSRSWAYSGELRIMTESEYLFHPTRIESEHLVVAPDGQTEKKKAVDYIFSVAEMTSLLEAGGFALEEMYSIPGRKKFTLGDPRAYIIAQKV